MFENTIDNSHDGSDSEYDEYTTARQYDTLWGSLCDPNINTRSKELLIKRAILSSALKQEPIPSVEGFIWQGRKVLESKENFKCGSALVPTSIGHYRLQRLGNVSIVKAIYLSLSCIIFLFKLSSHHRRFSFIKKYPIQKILSLGHLTIGMIWPEETRKLKGDGRGEMKHHLILNKVQLSAFL